MQDFWIFLLVGFGAQIVDGALGMAYGVISSTVLLAFGVPPATASASVHAAEVFTTAASAGSHAVNKNVNWGLFVPLALGGALGGGLGAFVLTSIDGDLLKPWITAYLSIMGFVIIWRATKQTRERVFPTKLAGPLGLVGGFFDAIGGGGWGPTVTTTMVGSGQDPRISIGTANTAEFFVTATISATFLAALLTGHWQQADGVVNHAMSVVGLIVGGLLAAPFAGIIARIAPKRVLTYGVGAVVLLSAGYQALRLFGVL
ncbi:sulfite exporter TauE/SafE family protein [Brevundimonas sp.]|uniref:sulfite exporter TauE/SafE family protein n=1 Tax=Brevundimonas sp. TaxID=1871086 RepID=UPI001A24AD38|nr:sulfite exporter TauE/SafE family protein [Brevundimonas sp.]MBJ7484047.1 sulfite exporter TauE/SafE family protein [Brevundimonas sp.]